LYGFQLTPQPDGHTEPQQYLEKEKDVVKSKSTNKILAAELQQHGNKIDGDLTIVESSGQDLAAFQSAV